MSKHKVFEDENEINSVLINQNRELNNFASMDAGTMEEAISSSEALLQNLGYDLPEPDPINRELILAAPFDLPTWEELSAKSIEKVGTGHDIEELFTEEELCYNSQIVRSLNAEFNQIHKLDKIDIGISVLAGTLAGIVDMLFVSMPTSPQNGLKEGSLAKHVREYFEKTYRPEDYEKLVQAKVPFDASINSPHIKKAVDGLTPYFHRLVQLGHDPLLGFVVGVHDIMTGKMTTIDKAGKILSQSMENYKDYATRKEATVFAAIAKEILHLKSDVSTPMGLPVPLMSLFNLLQFGEIGDAKQTIAEIVQGMYYEGYDFVHFCSMSITAMITEVVVRLGYTLKRLKYGYGIKDSIPFSIDRERNPKLGTMLFMGHAIATGINSGKVYITKNPVGINYPQWIAFVKYAYKQLNWVLINKPDTRDKYVTDLINEDLYKVLESIDETYESINKDMALQK